MGIKILTVDDSHTIRAAIVRAFRSFDCEVIEAQNGVAGLDAAHAHAPDLILLDYCMPLMNGWEMLGHIRADNQLKNTPVIVISSETERDLVVKFSKLGVQDYLIKPFTEELLIDRARRVVTLTGQKSPATRARRVDDPLTLMVVDENPIAIEQIRLALSGTSWEVLGFDQPDKALNACLKNPADIVLISLSLPRNSAKGLRENLKGYANTSAIPVMGLVDKKNSSDINEGFAGLIAKPVSGEELKAAVCKALGIES